MARGGSRVALHLRGPGTAGGRLFHLARKLAEEGGSLVINDRVDVALAVGLDQVHLGRRSLPAGVVRSMLGADASVGVSTHDVSEVSTAAREGADWLFVGTIYPTPSHPDAEGRGPLALVEAVAAARGIPGFAIGGVTPGRVPELLAAGAYGVAVVRGVWAAADPLAALSEYLDALASED
jgi:thiamine-phosphate diphosphorylase